MISAVNLISSAKIKLNKTGYTDKKNFKGNASIENDSLELSPETKKILELRKKYDTETIYIADKKYTSFVNSRTGSNYAKYIMDDDTGELFYLKISPFSSDIRRFKEEMTASKLYRLAGIGAPDMETCILDCGCTGIKSKYEPNLIPCMDVKTLHDGFAADCWLANWDSMNNFNTVTKDGKTFKIDCGGALRYRAQGMLKHNFDEIPDEIITMIDGRNLSAYSVYSSIDYSTLIKSFKKVANVSDEDIKNIVEDSELADILIARKKYMTDFLKVIKKTPYDGSNLLKYLQSIKSVVENK